MLVIEGRVWFRGELQELCVGVEDGKIVAVKKRLDGDERLDFGDDLVLPGGIDLHVHFREPGMTEKEDFGSGTLSAAIGGVTCVFDMPNTVPPATKAAALEAKHRIAAAKAHVDFGLYAGVTAKPSRLLEEIEAKGLAQGLKLYTAETTGDLALPWEQVPRVLAVAADSPLPVVVHAEDPTKFGRPGKDLKGHHLARPPEAEESAVRILAKHANVHLTHVTSIPGFEAAKAAGLSMDVTPHHLLFDTDSRAGAKLKVNPPLRPPEHRARLWEAFAAGEIAMLASDHAPHTAEEKAKFTEAPSGTPGVATTYPILMRIVKAGDLDLSRLLDAFCAGPARRFSLRKGQIEVGMDADFAVFDPRHAVRVTAKRTRYKCGWTAFEGLDAVFPRAVLLRGTAVVEDYEPIGETRGRAVVRGQSPGSGPPSL